MTAVLPSQHQSYEQPIEEISMDTVPESLRESESIPANKQTVKRPFFTPFKIVLLIAVVAAISFGSYQLYNLYESNQVKSEMLESHGKIIQYADSSKKEGSSTGSTSSKSSKTNDKPNAASKPAGKSPISSNGQGGLGGSGNGGKENEDEDDGEKRKKKLNDKKSLTNDISTDEDSEEDEGEDVEGQAEGAMWIDSTPTQGNTPLIGSARGG